MRLRGAYLTFHRMANAHFEQFAVSADQFVVLTLLAEEDGVTQRDLAEQASSDANTMSEMLARLEKKQLVRRERHPSDGRARCVFLTARGRKTQKQLWDSWECQVRAVDGAFRPGELDVLRGLLVRVPDAVAAAGEAT